MKIIDRIIIALLAIAPAFLTSCSDDAEGYSGNAGIYFVYSGNSYKMNYSFLTTTEDYIDAKITVQTLGLPSKSDRTFTMAIERSLSTATEGVDFEELPTKFVMPAGKTETVVTVRLKCTPRLENEEVRLALQLYKSDDFTDLLLDRSLVVLYWSNQLTKPARWDAIYKMYFGDYSKVKHRYILATLGWTEEEFLAAENNAEKLSFGGIMMNTWFKENSVSDEDGKPIKPWM